MAFIFEYQHVTYFNFGPLPTPVFRHAVIGGNVIRERIEKRTAGKKPSRFFLVDYQVCNIEINSMSVVTTGKLNTMPLRYFA